MSHASLLWLRSSVLVDCLPEHQYKKYQLFVFLRMNVSITHRGSGHHRNRAVNSSSVNDDDHYSVTSTVTIRVTPKEDYLISWGILWSGFLLASIIAAWQVWKEYKMLKARREADVEQAAEGVSSADITRSMVRRLFFCTREIKSKMKLTK